MKLVRALFVSALVAAPALAFAQSPDTPVTRASVRAELVQLQQAGYNPASDTTQYPKNIEAAQMRLNAQQNAAYGGAPASGTASGSRNETAQTPAPQQDVVGLEPIYAHS
ncbi:DUF4148 domain-containing protein [Paraburkholderia guartelaensis]|uniref:DUF4148 domain-containing protein n=1 Tax=Paraburkholderia guartelaensis TaxID=2546446 RepID=A0A4R5L611_9BURK|nr:DUF4148 domain-containing protein [Paraburkholderia guartelaensis]TDG03307.1 DUF4148 domain-containing protein [Paraburkholderia guartelaensis]